MRRIVLNFLRRGLIACGFGPMVLAVFYMILQQRGVIEHLTVNQVCMGIFSLSALAFIAGGMNVIYQMERLPLMIAILIHGSVLYISYLITYLLNGWLEWGGIPFGVFTGIFILGYGIIWVIIYSIMKKNTQKVNEILKRKQQNIE